MVRTPAAAMRGGGEPQRVTQGFVATITWTRRHPLLLLLEVAWRWIFGIPALWLLLRQGQALLDSVPWRATGVDAITINGLMTDPVQAAASLAAFAQLLMPPLLHTAAWLAPLLLAWWVVVSGVGRTFVLAGMDPAMRRNLRSHTARLVGAQLLLQAVRLSLPALLLGAWWFALRWVASVTLLRAGGGEPQMMLYTGCAIALTLGLFVLSAATSWAFGLAPVVSLLQGCNAAAALRRSLGARLLRPALFEMNLVLGIVKIALLVLAMVLSACPLPFSSVMSGQALLEWNVAVAIAYLLGSDFFHVARLVAYVELWRKYAAASGDADAF